MSKVVIRGWGAVSPAGWGTTALREALLQGEVLPTRHLRRDGANHAPKVRLVPPPTSRPGFINHARLRRASPIAQYAVAAALEALGSDAPGAPVSSPHLGIIFCAMAGCVNYSRRFYDETLKDPATASPVVFPETVFNAPASHLSALLGTNAPNYTLVGDPGTFLQGLALAADWLLTGQVKRCLLVGAEEMDWLIAEAFQLFDRQGAVSDGAGALCLELGSDDAPGIELRRITDAYPFSTGPARAQAALRAREELAPEDQANAFLCDSRQGVDHLDRDEAAAWRDWAGPRLSPKVICGEGFMAAAAWQCVAAVDTLARNGYSAANVSIVGCNQQAIAAQFVKSRN